MAKIRGKDTAPELRVRRLLHRTGYRFRLHRKDLPGKPDLVLAKHRLVIFVHGCFWHGHAGCGRAIIPSTRTDFWTAKIGATKGRDKSAEAALRALGFRVMTLWQCELRADFEILRRVEEAVREPCETNAEEVEKG